MFTHFFFHCRVSFFQDLWTEIKLTRYCSLGDLILWPFNGINLIMTQCKNNVQNWKLYDVRRVETCYSAGPLVISSWLACWKFTNWVFNWSLNAQVTKAFNNYSSSPNGLWVNSLWGQRPNGLLTQMPWGLEGLLF